MDSDDSFILNGSELKIEYEDNMNGYKLIYQDKELNINSKFMGKTQRSITIFIKFGMVGIVREIKSASRILQ